MRAFSSAGCASCGATTAASAASRAPASGAPSAASIPPSRSIEEITGALFPAQSFTSTEKTYRSPPRLCTYPESAVTRSSVPVFARNRPAASVPSMRSRMVPSRAAMPSEDTNSEATGNRFHTACKSVAICRAVKRLVSVRPLPFVSTEVPQQHAQRLPVVEGGVADAAEHHHRIGVEWNAALDRDARALAFRDGARPQLAPAVGADGGHPVFDDEVVVRVGLHLDERARPDA